MKIFSKNYQLPKNLDILFLIVLGIMLQMADGSPFSLKARWSLVWETELPSQFFSVFLQKTIKTLLSAIVVVRCTTTYAYVVSAMLVIFCLVKENYPKLMLLWLLVAGVKSISMTFIEALIGVYVCSAFGKIHKACIEFFISKALELIFAAFLWGNVLNIYLEMERKAKFIVLTQTKEQMFLQKVDFRRPRARSLVDESTLYKTARLNNFEFKDVPQIILHMLRRGDEMSEDSLLGPGMMLASVSNLGSFDSLKTSQSLGELGFVDLETTEVLGLHEDEPLSHKEKALKFLKLSQSDIKKIKLNKTPLEKDIFTIDPEIWKIVMASGTQIHKPKHARNQLFIHDIAQTESGYNKTATNKSQNKYIDYRLRFCIIDLLNKGHSGFDKEEEDEFGKQNEDDDEISSSDIFMSNRKISQKMNSHCVKIMGKKNYANLLQEDFMYIIGPEVYDKAPKLSKVTSLAVVNSKTGAKTSRSLPAFKIINTEEENEVKIYETSSSNLGLIEGDSVETVESSSGGKIQSDQETVKTKTDSSEMKKLQLACKEQDDKVIRLFQTSNYSCDDSERKKIKNKHSVPNLYGTTGDTSRCEEITQTPCYRKRRIIIVRRNKKRKRKIWFRNSSTDSQSLSRNSDDCSDIPSQGSCEEHAEPCEKDPSFLISESRKTNVDRQTHYYNYNKQVFFLRNLFEKPLFDILMTYYELKKKVELANEKKIFSNSSYSTSQGVTLQTFEFNHKKVWKSKVLQTVDLMYVDNFSPRESFSNSLKRKESLLRKLLRYQIASLVNKNIQNVRTVESIKKFNPDDVISKGDSQSNFNWDNNQPTADDLSGVESCSDVETEKPLVEEDLQSQISKFQNIQNLEVPEVPVDEYENQSLCSHDSDEPISLYYSKAADLSSPLFDMKRFIYPDHIHYSYKHVKKKGFDVDINGDLPLLVRESLTMRTPIQRGNKVVSENRDIEITSKPMDLSFAMSNAFGEWQNDVRSESNSNNSELTKKPKKGKRLKKSDDCPIKDIAKSKRKSYEYWNKLKYSYSAKDFFLIEKLLRMHWLFNKQELESRNRERKPTQISSTQLHSNRGSGNSISNPATFLHENKSRNERRKMENQHSLHKFSRKFNSGPTKDMFTRLEKEVLFQRKNFKNSPQSKFI